MVGFEDLELLLGTEPYYTSLKTHWDLGKNSVLYLYYIHIYVHTDTYI